MFSNSTQESLVEAEKIGIYIGGRLASVPSRNDSVPAARPRSSYSRHSTSKKGLSGHESATCYREIR